jgi:hypothetical protein
MTVAAGPVGVAVDGAEYLVSPVDDSAAAASCSVVFSASFFAFFAFLAFCHGAVIPAD